MASGFIYSFHFFFLCFLHSLFFWSGDRIPERSRSRMERLFGLQPQGRSAHGGEGMVALSTVSGMGAGNFSHLGGSGCRE